MRCNAVSLTGCNAVSFPFVTVTPSHPIPSSSYLPAPSWVGLRVRSVLTSHPSIAYRNARAALEGWMQSRTIEGEVTRCR